MGELDVRKSSLEADELLLGLIRKKDEHALSVFYDRRSGLVYSLAYSMLGDKSDAEEVTEEVFLKIWEKAESFDNSRGSALAWVTVMTRRLAIDKTRSKQYKMRSREASLEMADASGKLGEGHEEGERKIVMAAEATRISKALGQLDDSLREVIQLSYYEGLSHSKIAERLDSPLGTVKTRIREAVIQLRRILSVEV
jgi:RNA polymerase sigma-70 factor (ECF subfamily)